MLEGRKGWLSRKGASSDSILLLATLGEEAWSGQVSGKGANGEAGSANVAMPESISSETCVERFLFVA